MNLHIYQANGDCFALSGLGRLLYCYPRPSLRCSLGWYMALLQGLIPDS
jgi:hypothetical protein